MKFPKNQEFMEEEMKNGYWLKLDLKFLYIFQQNHLKNK